MAELEGKIGSSPVAYDVKIDALSNVVLALSYADVGASAISAQISASVPLGVILAALVAKLKSPIASEIESILMASVQSYLASLPSPQA